MSELHEECGVVAIYHLPNRPESPLTPGRSACVSRFMPRMLLDLQNRGQLSAGITTYNPSRTELLTTYKDVGTVSEVFHQNKPTFFHELMDRLDGPAAIGHVRYATVGQSDVKYAHPFERAHIKKNKSFSFAFNGQLANYEFLKEHILQTDPCAYLKLDADSEIFMRNLCVAVKDSERDLLKVCKRALLGFEGKKDPETGEDLFDDRYALDGAYTVVYMNAMGELFAARDPHGIKPLCYAFDGSLFAAASESVALFNLGFTPEQIQDVPPGGVVIVTPENGVEVKEFTPSSRTTHCFFEWIYFANVASVLDGKSVYLTRKKLGEELAKLEDVPLDENSIVVPVPDTSKAAADGMAYALGIPCLEGLMRNRYSGRTFIEGGEIRWRKAQSKYTPLPEVLTGKRIFLVEDSIVRSTTMRVLIDRIRNIGHAAEIHVRVACPPIMAPCFYGIDMSTYSELFATKFMVKHYGVDGVHSNDDLTTMWKITPEIEKEMAEDIGCDSLRFLPSCAISQAIGKPSMQLCEACFNHEYPTEWGCNLSQIALQNFIAKLNEKKD